MSLIVSNDFSEILNLIIIYKQKAYEDKQLTALLTEIENGTNEILNENE